MQHDEKKKTAKRKYQTILMQVHQVNLIHNLCRFTKRLYEKQSAVFTVVFMTSILQNY